MTGERFVLAFDQGTTSSRAIVFDRAGSVVAVAQQEVTQHYPVPGHVEHDAMEIWRTQQDCAAAALAQARAEPADLAAIGITNQRETVVVWDAATGVPVHRAIVWQDRRTAEACAQLQKSGAEVMVRNKTGLRLDPYFSATKLRWILDHVPGARAAAERGQLRAGTIDTWLLWQLTAGKVHATDASNASRTLLYDLKKGDWDDELLALFKVPRSLLPEVRDSISMFGDVAAGLPAAGVPIAGIAGDQQAALFGQACFQPGMAKNTYGTGCFLLLHTGTEAVPSQHDLLTTVAWRIAGVTEYALEGSVFVGGAVVQWLRDELKLVRSATELDELAASVPDAGGAFLVPAFTGLGAPHWDPWARGILCGITRGTGRAQLCRAALESIALQSADLMDCMAQDSGIALQQLRVDGGAARSAPLLQIQADLLGVPVVRPRNVETTALGACYLAGLAVGFWQDRAEIARQWQAGTTFRPARPPAEMDSLRGGWRRAVARAKGWAGG